VAASLVLWVLTSAIASMMLAARPHSALARAALAALGIGGFIAWILVAGKSIFAQDALSQRVHLVAMATAFAVTAVVACANDFLHRAGFVPALSVGSVWIIMVVLWWLSIIAASWYYR
jgi:hypothetical protein